MRRTKNNIAAKRSREARRIKENQIALRAAFLEKENNALKDEVNKIKEENVNLQKKLSQYEQQAIDEPSESFFFPFKSLFTFMKNLKVINEIAMVSKKQTTYMEIT